MQRQYEHISTSFETGDMPPVEKPMPIYDFLLLSPSSFALDSFISCAYDILVVTCNQWSWQMAGRIQTPVFCKHNIMAICLFSRSSVECGYRVCQTLALNCFPRQKTIYFSRTPLFYSYMQFIQPLIVTYSIYAMRHGHKNCFRFSKLYISTEDRRSRQIFGFF